MFELHPQLAKDCVHLGDFPLCQVLLNRDSHYPWLILVPRREDISEIYQLDGSDQQQLLKESSALSASLMEHCNADKMNVAALGNMVPQLHVHHIARFKTDIAWPNPVWGFAPALAYSEQNLALAVSRLRAELAKLSIEFVPK
ncbi:HIT domain-containing protein [Dasania sp. GY-MA-18]|uniref:HIT domain-containing protein n=1 Tax=Dasania phycosphaerae TaxID=2950436 RepID=A0A9J6RH24_9GAMM|nr:MULTISPECIES: HIT domain-containing protein [Dasania]MCR8921156.1 HIT domain-containing protein [Dasania sp. GY-MA-18]MCZ0863584.1 HIT domain-containing protein [Dasania phycosphaerae]MCZ0867312.1 HIT domain-containing protein [Dasania phycosphaerae]